MSNERKALSIPGFNDLDDFEPRNKPQSTGAPKIKKIVDKSSSFPSREVATEGQLNLKGPSDILDRFKNICKADRRPYYEMLEILMNHYEQNNK